MKRLLPEWEPSEAIVLAWPNENTDWARWLPSVQTTYCELIKTINQADCSVILLHRAEDELSIKNLLPDNVNVLMVEAKYNDTWARDFAFLTCENQGKRIPVEFIFNGWGNKFDATLDNLVNQRYLSPLCRYPLTQIPVVCEGGALEIDATGHLLSTQLCLSNPERNDSMSMNDYELTFKQGLGATVVTILEQGHLEGDDTDGHIDTLVRFTPDSGVVIQSCFNHPNDSHFASLSALVNECSVRLPEHIRFELPLPIIYSEDNQRLPASYANYLICNGSIICPIYQQPEDELALEVLKKAYPSFTIRPVDCLSLVQQYGSLHCITMQIPKDTLLTSVSNQLQKGVTQYGQ